MRALRLAAGRRALKNDQGSSKYSISDNFEKIQTLCKTKFVDYVGHVFHTYYFLAIKNTI